MSDVERRPNEDETGRGCLLVDRWEAGWRVPTERRVRESCGQCALKRRPTSTALYRRAINHIAMREAQIEIDQSGYDDRLRAAILHVKAEMHRIGREQSGEREARRAGAHGK